MAYKYVNYLNGTKNLKIFRQESDLKWDKVIKEVRTELNKSF